MKKGVGEGLRNLYDNQVILAEMGQIWAMIFYFLKDSDLEHYENSELEMRCEVIISKTTIWKPVKEY